MSLTERIRTAQRTAEHRGGATGTWQSRPTDAVDGLAGFKTRLHDELFDRLGTRLFEAADEAQMRALVVEEIGNIMAATDTALSVDERQQLVRDIARDVMGLGPIEQYLADPTVSEIMVNGPNNIYVERNGVIQPTDTRFISEEHLRRVVDRIVTSVGRRIDESAPMVDARLADGSRVNAVVPPLSLDGSILTIRKFAKDPFTAADLVAVGALSPQGSTLLSAAVEGGMNIIVSGGTGTGKTTLLNVLSSFVPSTERIVTIEDAVELQLHQRHVIRLEARPANIEGEGEVSIRDLVRNALRMRPDRIIVGEVRGAEALDMLQAMNTGHDGSLSTVHANAPRDAISRIETMVMMAGLELPMRAIREQVASAVDLIVQLERFRDGSRRVSQVTEVVGMEGEIISLQDILKYDHRDQRLAPTGVRPRLVDHLEERGVAVPHDLFDTVDPWDR